MPSTPQWKLRRLASRAKRVVERRASESAALSAFAITLPERADAFIGAYDAANHYRPTWRRELTEGRGAVAALSKTMQAWLPALVRDVPGFRASDYTTSPEVPDDLINAAEALLGVAAHAVDTAGAPLAYGPALLDALESSTRAATKEWQEAEAADKRHQSLSASIRASAAVFDTELQLFRRSFLAVVGRSDKDYQKLRVERAGAVEADDDPAAPAPEGPIAPGEPPRAG